jgi:protein SCO1/2
MNRNCWLAILALWAFSLTAHSHEIAPVRGSSSETLYSLQSPWTDQKSHKFTFADLRGRPVLITMAYTGCQYTCPLTVAKLKEIEAAARAQGAGDFYIVVASFDPSGDKPAHLLQYAKEKDLSPSKWILLSPASDSKVRELSAALGISYTKIKGGDFAHSNIISLLDKEGKTVSQLVGLGTDAGELIRKLVRTSK